MIGARELKGSKMRLSLFQVPCSDEGSFLNYSTSAEVPEVNYQRSSIAVSLTQH